MEQFFEPFEDSIEVDEVSKRFSNKKLAEEDIVFTDFDQGSGKNSGLKKKASSKGKSDC